VTRTDAGGLRERHKQSTRRALVDAALRLFTERGYAQVTVEDICAAVDVSPRTFFRYFPTKEHVLAEPVTRLLAAIRESLAAQPRSGTVWQALRTSVLAGVGVIEQSRTEFLRSAQVIRERPGALASSAAALMEWEQVVRDEVGQRLGADPVTMWAQLLLGTTMLAVRAALDRWADGAGAEPVRALVETALDAVEPGARALERSAKSGAAAH
jgi:AcrR family transcriptional regulator